MNELFRRVRSLWEEYIRNFQKLPPAKQRQVAIGAGVAALVLLMAASSQCSGGQNMAQAGGRPEQRTVEQRAQQARDAAEQERARVAEEQWQQYAREHSNNELSRKIVYHSKLWIPCLAILAVIYALTNGSFMFIAFGKVVMLGFFLLSSVMLVARYNSDLAQWQMFQQVRDVVTGIATDASIPVNPVAWVAAAIVLGILLETLARGSRKPALNVNVNKL